MTNELGWVIYWAMYLDIFKGFIKKNSVFVSCIRVVLKHLRKECKIFAQAAFLGLFRPFLFVM